MLNTVGPTKSYAVPIHNKFKKIKRSHFKGTLNKFLKKMSSPLEIIK